MNVSFQNFVIWFVIALSAIRCSEKTQTTNDNLFKPFSPPPAGKVEDIQKQLLGKWSMTGWKYNPLDKRYYSSDYFFQEKSVIYITRVSANGVDELFNLGVSGDYVVAANPKTRGVFSLSVTPHPNRLWFHRETQLEEVAPEPGSDGWKNMINYQEVLGREHQFSIIEDQLYLDSDVGIYAYGYTRASGME